MTILLCGDVMTGRGIDQVLPFPSGPELHESYARSALDYVELAEEANGPIPRPVAFDYVWGDALEELRRATPDARIVNLETAVTISDDWEPKGINYRMHPRNVPCLTAASIDCCVLANNHVLDWGRRGLEETLTALETAGIRTAGAGTNREGAWEPGIVATAWGRVLVFAACVRSSGVPRDWSATRESPGVNRLVDLSDASADEVSARLRRFRGPGDVVVFSVHWGGNWGYRIPDEHRAFAHRLIDAGGADVIHGHSSHHPIGVELYRGRPILYGCGDFLNDYEGISGHEEYRSDLVLMYLVTLDVAGLIGLRMVPFQIHRFRLRRPSEEAVEWLHRTLRRESTGLATDIELRGDGSLEARPD